MFHRKKPPSINVSSCRICLKTVDQSGYLLDENSDLLKLFIFCTDITELPHMAKRICSKCEHKIRTYAKFKRMCIEANVIWKSLEKKNAKHSTHKLPQEVIHNSVKYEIEQIDVCDDNHSFCYEEEPILDPKTETEEKSQQLYIVPHSVNNYNKSLKLKSTRKTKVQDLPKPKMELIPKSVISYCGLCDYSTESKEEHRKHLAEHWSRDGFKCSVCNLSSRDAAELLTHRYTHYPNGQRGKFICHMCEKLCASLLSLEFHYRSVHLQLPGGFCSQCMKSFNMFSTWKKHVRWHNTERFICDHCGKKFLYRHQIEGHLIDHSDKRNFICETCGKAFKRKFNLKTHVASVHSSEPIKCAHCDKVFKSHVTYKDHVKVLKADKPYACLVCGKSYHLESALRSHMFWHSGEKPHICQVCGLKYKSKGQLKIHERNHTGHLPYKCRECDKCFNNSQSLKRHQSVHTGRRANKCLYCERTFHMKKSLREHCATSHKDQLNGGAENVH